ncbi:MAG: CDP-diacylglycerol--serine O-phosphatidyltransferase [Planctomycetota bacterium]
MPASQRDDPDDDPGEHRRRNRREDAGQRTSRNRRGKRSRSRRTRKRRLTLAVLPTLLTLGNAVCGLAAIATATSSNLTHWSDGTQLLAAGLLIFGGMVFDALDGSAARMTGAESQFGAQLDSLCDSITFGAAPAVLVWRFADGQALPSKVVWAIGVLFALCVLIRLARFNVETEDDDPHEGFEGLPSPAAAGTLAAFAIAMPEFYPYLDAKLYPLWVQNVASFMITASQYFMPLLALLLAYLMVSRFQYPHLFQRLIRGRRSPHQIGQAMFVIIGIAVLHWLALPIVFLAYTMLPPLRQLSNSGAKTSPPSPLIGETDSDAVKSESVGLQSVSNHRDPGN